MNLKNMAAMALSALLCLTTTGAMAAQETYNVSVKEGTEDASNWQGKAGEGEYQALPLEGVAAGTAVTVKYNGTKRVKSVKAVKVMRTAIVTAPTAVAASLTYSGSAQTLFSAGSTTGGTMKYKVTTTNSKPESTADFKTTIDQGTNVGTYYLWYYVDGGDNYISTDVNGTAVTKAIGKAATTVTTAPTAKTGVKAGRNEAIVNAGTATGGTMMYKVTTANTKPTSTDGFSATVPTSAGLTEACTRYVWYYVEGDASHTDSEISASGIEVTIDAAPALNLTSLAVGQVIGDDGKNYNYASLPSGVTAVAKICYVSGSHGLALALADEGAMKWSPAISTCAAHTPAITGGTWKLATQDEWNNMITAAGSYTALRTGFSSVGGSNLQSDTYWSSTEKEFGSSYAWYFYFVNGNWGYAGKDGNNCRARACLAW